MYRIYNLINNPNVEVNAKQGPFTVISHKKNLQFEPNSATEAYYQGLLHRHKRQLIISLSQGDVNVQQGMMQWMVGDCSMVSGVTGISDYIGRKIKSRLMKQQSIHPEYTGSGLIVLEPVDNDILLVNLDDWNQEIVLSDGLFLACESSVRQFMVARDTMSSAVLGKEGFFNLCLQGTGLAALQIPVTRDELVEVILEEDQLKVDGNCAIAWSNSLMFTVEKSGRTFAASALSGEGFVNTYTGTGKILLAPMAMKRKTKPEQFPEQMEQD